MVVDIKKTVQAITGAFEEAKLMAGKGRFAGGGSSVLSKTLNQLRQWMHDLW